MPAVVISAVEQPAGDRIVKRVMDRNPEVMRNRKKQR